MYFVFTHTLSKKPFDVKGWSSQGNSIKSMFDHGIFVVGSLKGEGALL